MLGRTSARTLMVLLGVAGALLALVACGDSKAPTGSGNVLIDDSHHAGDELPPPPPTDPSDALPDMLYPTDAVTEYAPALDTCAACTCDPSAYFCFAGGVAARLLSGDAGEGGGGAEGGGEAGSPVCPIVSGSKTQVGCNALPAACAASPTCECVIQAIQPGFQCYLVCSPDPGYLRVYCPNP